MARVKPTSDGATADAWSRAASAIEAWRDANPDLEFDGILDETAAWADHMRDDLDQA